jgi:glycosyltransferase involved in cell wall biosynthesis
MRVLVVSSVFPNAKQPGFGIFVRERVARMAGRCEIAVVAPVPWFPFNRVFRGASRSGIERLERQGSLTVHHPRAFSIPGVFKALDGVFYFLSVLPLVARIRRDFPFDVIDAHFAYPDGLAARLLGLVFRRPVMVTLRGTIVPLSRFRLRRAQIGWALRAAGRVVAVSESLKEAAVALGIAAASIRVIPNGVDTEVFTAGPKDEARRALGLPAQRRVILSVGMLVPRKGHQRVMEVMPTILKAYPDALYVVVGGAGVEGDTEPLLRRQIEELGLHDHVRLVGSRPHEEIARWLTAADVFCLATSNEGRANVILEALACGVPVVTTDVGGSREVILEGVDGSLVPFGEPAALAEALIRGLATGWDRAAIAGRAAARTWDRTVEDTLAELSRLALGRIRCFRDLRPDQEEPRMIGALWRKRLYRVEAIALMARDVIGRRYKARDNRVHLAEAAQWLLRADDASPDPGVSGGYDFEEGWLASYPETTGYIIPTLLAYAGYSGEDEYQKRALGMANWLLTVQHPGGGFPGHFIDREHPPVVFNTGQIMFGLLGAYETSGDPEFLGAAKRAAEWLGSVQDEDGGWHRFEYRDTVHAYNSRTAWALAELGLLAGEPEAIAIACRNLDWTLAQQAPNGWLRHCAFDPEEDPFLHTIAYATQGLLEAGVRLRREDYVSGAMRACRAVLAHVDERGFIPATFDPEWRPTARYSCLTGNAQMAVQWYRLFKLTGDEMWRAAARRTVNFLKTLHDCSGSKPAIRGAVKGSHPIWGRYLFGTYPNWAVKFFMDALLVEEALEKGDASWPRHW